MSGRILIVDDDIDFSALLADVFTQADYTVQVVNDPKTIEKVIDASSFDLLISDLRMPGRDGFEIVSLMRARFPALPVIMVSGFLDPETRQRIEAEGIVGIYEKPLSVFTLLKTAGKVITEAAALSAASDSNAAMSSKGESPSNNLGFSFESLPCRSPASMEFATQLNRQALKRPNFCIVGEPGLPVTAMADDIASWLDSEAEKSACTTLDASEISEDRILQAIDEAALREVHTLHLILTNADQLSAKQQTAVYSASRRETYADRWSGSVRMIFFIGADSEKLYADGIIGNSLYLLMGTQEIQIPPLRNCREDIEAIARDFLAENNPQVSLDPKTLDLLRSFEWPQNHVQLRKLLRDISSGHQPGIITAEEVSTSLAGVSSSESSHKIQGFSLRERLELARNDYLRATGILSDLVKES